MPRPPIDIPGVGVITFPDSMSDAEVDAKAKELHDQAQGQSAQQPSWLGGLASNALKNVGDYGKMALDVMGSTPPGMVARAVVSPLTGESLRDIASTPQQIGEAGYQAVKRIAQAAPYAFPASHPELLANPDVQAAGAQFAGGALQAAKDNLTPTGWYNHPVDALMNAISLGTATAPRAVRMGTTMEQGGVNLLAHTLGSPVTDRADLLESARTLLGNRIPRSQAGKEQLATQIAPMAAEKEAELAASPNVKLKPGSFANLNTLIDEKAAMTPNSAKPYQAAVAQRDRVLDDPNLFVTQTQTRPLSDADVAAMMRDATNDSARTQQVLNYLATNPQITTTTRTARANPLSYIEKLKQDAAAAVAEAKGYTPVGPDVSNDIAARRAVADDWRNIVATVNPRVGQLNEQLAPLYSAQSQLTRALESGSAPHYANLGGILGAIGGGVVGHYGGHQLAATAAGATIGASFMNNPYQLLGRVAQGTFDTGRGLMAAGNALDQPTVRNLALSAAGARGVQRLGDEDEEERARQLQQALTSGIAMTQP